MTKEITLDRDTTNYKAYLYDILLAENRLKRAKIHLSYPHHKAYHKSLAVLEQEFTDTIRVASELYTDTLVDDDYWDTIQNEA